MKQHLVTGGSGFLGNLVARRLLDRGERVRVLDTWSDPTRPAGVDFIEGTILSRDTVRAAMQGVDTVHHTAALVAQSDAGERYFEVNRDGARIVAEEAAAAGVRSFVHVSTTAVFGLPPDTAITAATALRPIEPYGKSKLAGEGAVAAICRENGMALVTIRPRATLGASRLGVFQILFDWIRDGRKVFVIGPGDNRVQFIHADDLIDFYMLALETERPGTYNVGTDRFGTLREDLGQLIAHAGTRSRVASLPVGPAIAALRLAHAARLSPLVPWHFMTYHRHCHFELAPLLALGWRPKYSNAEMLVESYDWFLAERAKGSARSLSPHRSPLAQGILRLVKSFS